MQGLTQRFEMWQTTWGRFVLVVYAEMYAFHALSLWKVTVNTRQTALHIAAKNGKEKSAQALLDGGANVLLRDKIGKTAEMLGEEVKCAAVVALLSEAAVEQKESQISHAEIALKNAEEAAMMRDQPRQLQELAKAAAAFELASDERLAEVQQQMVSLRATK